jgi:hypothetical protein
MPEFELTLTPQYWWEVGRRAPENRAGEQAHAL